MPPKLKAFGQLQWRQRERIVAQLASVFQQHCPCLEDATQMLQQLVRKCQSFLPELALDTHMCAQLVGTLGSIRAAISEGIGCLQPRRPRISIAELDAAVCSLPTTHATVKQWGYNLSTRAYTSALEASAHEPASSSATPSNVGGRPSKINNKQIIDLVRGILPKYLKESERIAVIGHGNKRRMVVAQHLTKKRHSIFLAESELREVMGKDTFRRIMRIHFPHVRNPRRLTDICSLAFWALISLELSPHFLKKKIWESDPSPKPQSYT